MGVRTSTWGVGAEDERQITPLIVAESLDLLPGRCAVPNLAWRVPLLNSQQAGLSAFTRQRARLWVQSRSRVGVEHSGLRQTPPGGSDLSAQQPPGKAASSPLARPLLGAWPCGPLPSSCKVGINYSYFTEEESKTQRRESPDPGTKPWTPAPDRTQRPAGPGPELPP